MRPLVRFRDFTLVTLFVALVFVPLHPCPARAGTPSALQQLSPVPGARWVRPETGILVRLVRPIHLDPVELAKSVEVVGAESGVHAGRAQVVADGRALVFRPERAFRAGERVDVSLSSGLLAGDGVAGEPFAYSFVVAATSIASSPATRVASWVGEAGLRQSLAARPGAEPSSTDSVPPDFPAISSNVYSTPTPGLLFLSNVSFGPPTTNYLMILDDSGTPIFSRRMNGPCFDFKRQPNGLMTYYDVSGGHFYAMDASFAIVDSFSCDNGYTDLHELHLLPNGNTLIMSYDPETVDMSQVVPGGNPAATVTGLIIQELDGQKNKIFEWRSWDHFQITDATHEDLTASAIDYVHGNSLELDGDGNLLVSCRHMDEVTKINLQTGAVMWRWGGKNNQFTFLDDTLEFSHQHAVRRLANGHITLWDNGNYHAPNFSRAVEYEMDENALTARRVWEYRGSPDVYGFAMGYVQRLSNGNTLIGVGAGKPDIIEVAPDGSKVMDMTLPPGIFTYRVYRYDWQPSASVSMPTHRADLGLAVRPNPIHDQLRVAFRLTAPAAVRLAVYDVGGRRVATAFQDAIGAGPHELTLNLTGHPAGLYFVRLKAGDQADVTKVVRER